MCGLPFRGGPRLRPSFVGPPRSVGALGSPFRVWWPPPWGVPLLVLIGVPPCSLAARRGRALLGEGTPSPFPPSLAAHARRSQPFRGGTSPPSPCCRVLLLAVAPWGVVPPFRPLCCARGCCRPRAHSSSHQRVLSRGGGVCWRVPSVIVCMSSLACVGPVDWASLRRGQSRAGGVCCRAPRAAGSLFRPHCRLRVPHLRRSPWRLSVSAIGRLLLGWSGGGWIFVPSPPTASILPPPGSRRCGGSQSLVSHWAPAFSGG